MAAKLEIQEATAERQIAHLTQTAQDLTRLKGALKGGVLSVGRSLTPRQLRVAFQAGKAFTALVNGRFGTAIIRGLSLVRVLGQELGRAGLELGR